MKLRQVQLFSIAVLSFGMALSCTSKKAASNKEAADEEPEEPSNPLPSPSPSPSNPCTNLKLVDEFDDEGEEEGEDEETGSKTGTATKTGTEESGNVSDCGDQSGTDTGGGGGGPYDLGPGIDGCKEQGLVWIAVKDVGGEKKGACGDKLADFCCSEENIAALFPTMASQLKTKFDGYKGDGFKLYGCSEASGKYSFHFGKGDSGAAYKSAFVSGVSPKSGVTAPATCPAVTIEDMGFSKDTDTDTDSDTDTASNTATGTGTGTTTGIPASIGEITATTKAGIFDFLSTLKYKDAAKFVNGSRHASTTAAHGDVDVKIFYNKTLQTSDKAWTNTSKKQALNSIAVIELYDGKGAAAELKGWAVMAKAKNEEGKDSWLFAKITGTAGTPPVFSEITEDVRALGQSNCADCHDNDAGALDPQDFIHSRAP